MKSSLLYSLTILFTALLMVSCSQSSGDKLKENPDKPSIDGIDYRPILGKNYNSDEVRLFFIDNKISPDKEYLKIKLDDNNNIEQIFFKEKCPPQSMPFGSSFLLTKMLAKKRYGEPSFIFNRTFVYDSLNLGIQFSSDPNYIDDIGVFSDNVLNEIKSRL
jgi:hypothetical protein